MAACTAVLYPSRTPAEYHRIVSQTLQIPQNPQLPIPVGLLACQRDPLLRELETVVVNCTVSHPAPAPSTKKTKKAVLAPEIPLEPLLQVTLHDTVIFPEGGGQPTDTGAISTSDGRIWRVLLAKRHGGHAVHYVQIEDIDTDTAVLAFSPGTNVKVFLGQDDFDRRYDHMSMHTSQHLLSALLETQLGLPTLSWSLTAYPSPCYVEIPRGMTIAEISSIQDSANRLVFDGRNVHVEVAELDRQAENEIPKLESGRAVGKALPHDYTGGVKRIVVIEGIDRNPCCGTHLPSLHNLQLFLLPHTEALSRSSTTSARLYFLAGPRLITHLTSTHTFLTNTASLLSCGTSLVPERVAQVIEERKRAEKRVDGLEEELGKRISNDLAQEMKGYNTNTRFVKHVHRSDDSVDTLWFLSAISSSFSDLLSNEGTPLPHLLVLSSSPSAQSASSISVILIVGSDQELVKHVGNELKTKLSVKGGGKGTKWSGKYTGIWKDNENTIVDRILKGLS